MFEKWKEERLDALYEKHPNAAAHIRQAYIEIYNLQALTPKPTEACPAECIEGKLSLVLNGIYSGEKVDCPYCKAKPAEDAGRLKLVEALRKISDMADLEVEGLSTGQIAVKRAVQAREAIGIAHAALAGEATS